MAVSRRILVIESSLDVGDALCQLLELWGHHATFAGTGRRGVRQAVRDSPDVIVLDLGLEDMDGCQVVQQIRAEPMGDGPVIIAYSGYLHREQPARDAGCDAFILKPQIDELESLIQGTRESVRQFVETAGPAVQRRR